MDNFYIDTDFKFDLAKLRNSPNWKNTKIRKYGWVYNPFNIGKIN